MDAALDAQFQRIETALGSLIESITSYNFSVQAAQDLVAADDELSKELEQLAIHQTNYARIVSLRQTVEALDNQIKGTLGQLADVRKELLDSPVTTFPASSRDVPFDELLTYAKYIGRYTVPPTFRERITEEDVAALDRPAPGDAKMANGETPAPADDATKEATADTDGTSSQNPYFQKLQEDLGKDKQPELPWEPWPSAETIWVGNLKTIQNQIAEGIDPATVLSPEEQEAAERRKAEEDKKEQEARDAEERQRRDMYRHRAAQQQQGPQGPQQETEVDEFNLYDPDED